MPCGRCGSATGDSLFGCASPRYQWDSLGLAPVTASSSRIIFSTKLDRSVRGRMRQQRATIDEHNLT